MIEVGFILAGLSVAFFSLASYAVFAEPLATITILPFVVLALAAAAGIGWYGWRRWQKAKGLEARGETQEESGMSSLTREREARPEKRPGIVERLGSLQAKLAGPAMALRRRTGSLRSLRGGLLSRKGADAAAAPGAVEGVDPSANLGQVLETRKLVAEVLEARKHAAEEPAAPDVASREALSTVSLADAFEPPGPERPSMKSAPSPSAESIPSGVEGPGSSRSRKRRRRHAASAERAVGKSRVAPVAPTRSERSESVPDRQGSVSSDAEPRAPVSGVRWNPPESMDRTADVAEASHGTNAPALQPARSEPSEPAVPVAQVAPPEEIPLTTPAEDKRWQAPAQLFAETEPKASVRTSGQSFFLAPARGEPRTAKKESSEPPAEFTVATMPEAPAPAPARSERSEPVDDISAVIATALRPDARAPKPPRSERPFSITSGREPAAQAEALNSPLGPVITDVAEALVEFAVRPTLEAPAALDDLSGLIENALPADAAVPAAPAVPGRPELFGVPLHAPACSERPVPIPSGSEPATPSAAGPAAKPPPARSEPRETAEKESATGPVGKTRFFSTEDFASMQPETEAFPEPPPGRGPADAIPGSGTPALRQPQASAAGSAAQTAKPGPAPIPSGPRVNGNARGRDPRTQRVFLSVPVLVRTPLDCKQTVREETRTQVVQPMGATVLLEARVQRSETLVLINLKTGTEVRCRVTDIQTAKPGFNHVELEFAEEAPKFWGIRFPSDSDDPTERRTAPRPRSNGSTTTYSTSGPAHPAPRTSAPLASGAARPGSAPGNGNGTGSAPARSERSEPGGTRPEKPGAAPGTPRPRTTADLRWTR